LLIIYTAILSAVSFAVFMLYQPYFQEIKLPLIYFGWLFFAMYILSAIGAKMSDKIETFLKEKWILFVIAF